MYHITYLLKSLKDKKIVIDDNAILVLKKNQQS